ncbi:hypothetical protein [Cerasicoccus fimbriatus]|uniref:hypothetical protein n=1 Tax=Cerasicoccus fimbriatus TaxID=3014554 RepID=UPI0022B54C4E|nr:hypothetical protein [Cerasicoccus sp. TK19100]
MALGACGSNVRHQPNASGKIELALTQGPNNDKDTGFIYLGAMTLTAVPEPGTWVLFAGAIALASSYGIGGLNGAI